MSFDETRRMVTRTEGFNWHVEFMSQSMAEVIGAVSFLSGLKIPYVFDHVAHAEPHQNAADHEFKELLGIFKNEEHVWINLYSFYQLSKAGPPDYADMVDVIRAIIQTRSDHVIWGSNWPHGGCASAHAQRWRLVGFSACGSAGDETANLSSWTIQPNFTAGLSRSETDISATCLANVWQMEYNSLLQEIQKEMTK